MRSNEVLGRVVAFAGSGTGNSVAASRLSRHLGISNRSIESQTRLFSSNSRPISTTCMAASQEEQAAAAAAKTKSDDQPTLFDKIISKEIPATIVYEDDLVLAFRDISPQAPTHIILVPKQRNGLTQLSKATEGNKEVLGHLLLKAGEIAKAEKLDEGFRVVINNGPQGCQSVYHLHLHIIGGRQMKWPPG
ncbi:histidine triad family protein [Klebsormidium nitens]|uniref:Histidine triad family protein n=1 Tax=Klebsormidium nitens TaxID=105231 RepID=A0A1Y1HUK9_KLENI|nr:histidine triad family protein [Klebsormidium nitens]|eukprot:GAQ79538.1 histidine triad family protein [Klebsormidium nitens]